MDTTDNEFGRVVEAIDRAETDPTRHLSIQMDEACREAIRAAKKSGKASKVNVEITFKPKPDRRINFSGIVKPTLPKPPTNEVTMFADEDGAIHDADPINLKLPHSGFTRREPKPTPTIVKEGE